MTKDKQILELNRTINTLMAHPDNEPNSEFADRIDSLIDLKKQLSLCSVVSSLPSRLEMNNQAEKDFDEMKLITNKVMFKHFRLGFGTCYEWMLSRLHS